MVDDFELDVIFVFNSNRFPPLANPLTPSPITVQPINNSVVAGLTSNDDYINNIVNRIRTIQQEFVATNPSLAASAVGSFRSLENSNKDVKK